ncbi:MAG: NUDIX hydrolase [Clostridiales bacterium]|nr:NUDIX hydrolase [Clostridiales bacterium]
MGYISDLRKALGSRPVIGVGATVLVINSEGKILLNRRSDTGTWGIPGGSKELNETIEECALRELKEETDISARDLRLLTVLSGPEYYFKYPNGDEMDTVIVLFSVRDYSGTLRINDGESTELKFFSLDHLPVLESRAAAILEKVRSGKISLG